MFRNGLSYGFAQSFHRSCLIQPLKDEGMRHRLLRSAELMLQHFSRALRTSDIKERSRCLFVSLQCARDCAEILDEAGVPTRDEPIRCEYQVLHARLEKLCLDAATEGEGGQLRMLG
jgi:hypothetical protein